MKYKILMILFIIFYILAGLYTEIQFISKKPIPESLLEDFLYYEQALNNALNGISPYLVREIGPGYLYPPPALLIVEVFHKIAPFTFKALIYSIFNISILLIMVYGIGKYYKYSFTQIWYWYFICLYFAPFLELIHLGQINVITMFGVFTLFIYIGREKFLGGIGLALAVITKVSPALFFCYLIFAKKWKVITTSIVFIIFFVILSIIRYGINSILEYPSVFLWLTSQFDMSINSQSFVSKIAYLQKTLFEFLSTFINFDTHISTYFERHYQPLHKFLILYMIVIILISSVLFYINKEKEKEPLFIILNLAMMLSPNIIWYHHYVFLLLPVLIWIGWSQLNTKVMAWCLFGLLLIQIDRWHLLYGAIAHIFGHISILILLIYQYREVNFQTEKVIMS